MIAELLVASLACASAFQAPVSRTTTTQLSISMSMKPMEALRGPAAAASALAIPLHSEAAHAKSVVGVNGGLDFGPLAGDQPGGEGTGKVSSALSRAAPCTHCPQPAVPGVRRVFAAPCCTPLPHQGVLRIRLPVLYRLSCRLPNSWHSPFSEPSLAQALGINDDSLLFALGGVVLVISVLFAQWQVRHSSTMPLA